MIFTDPFKNPELQAIKLDVILHKILQEKENTIIISEMFGAAPKTSPKAEVIWKAEGGSPVPISMLKTRHLFFALRLVYNNLIPIHSELNYDNKRVLKFRSTEDGKRVLAGMFEEIGKRDNLTDDQLKHLSFMAAATRKYL